MALPQNAKEVIDKQTFAHVATLNADGSPQVTPVWIDADGDHVIFNTARGRLKDRNLGRDPRIAISMTDPDNPYNAVTIQGRVVEMTEDGADPHIDSLAKKYMGVDEYPLRQPGEVRVIVKVEPEKVGGMGG